MKQWESDVMHEESGESNEKCEFTQLQKIEADGKN